MGNFNAYFHLITVDIGTKEMTKEATRNSMKENSQASKNTEGNEKIELKGLKCLMFKEFQLNYLIRGF